MRKGRQCRDCPAGAKLAAHYPDEQGKACRLCAEHAKRAGSWVRCQARPSPSQLRSATYKALEMVVGVSTVQHHPAPASPRFVHAATSAFCPFLGVARETL